MTPTRVQAQLIAEYESLGYKLVSAGEQPNHDFVWRLERGQDWKTIINRPI